MQMHALRIILLLTLAVALLIIPAIAVETVAAAGEDVFMITATAGEHGSISPSGQIDVNSGADQTFTISPEPRQLSCFGSGTLFVVWNITVDGQDIPARANHPCCR